MEKLTYQRVNKIAHDEKACRKLLEQIRWGDEPYCPHCGSLSNYRLTPKPESKHPVRDGVLKCKDCRKQFTVTVGTVMERSRITLGVWLQAITLLCASKKGMSAHQLHRQLGITYKTAWFLAHKVRHAMSEGTFSKKLSGVVEADETYVGGKQKGGKGRSTKKKTPVFALVERGGNVRSFVVANVTEKTLKGLLLKNVEKTATIMTDEYPSYSRVHHHFPDHQSINHSLGQYVNGDIYTNTIEGYFSILKRGIVGTYHHVSKEHLNRYLNEFNFRYNSRKDEDSDRTALAIQGIAGKRLMYRDSSNNRKGNLTSSVIK